MDLEDTFHHLTPEEKSFFQRMQNYLHTKVYFYGSVNRQDYFRGKSDIDVDIFTRNMESTLSRLQHFLNVSSTQFRKTYRLLDSKHIAGYKVYYVSTNALDEPQFSVEISIFQEKDKEYVLKEHRSKSILPFHAVIMLVVLKFFYYDLHLLPRDTYKRYKNSILSDWIGRKETPFSAIKNSNRHIH